MSQIILYSKGVIGEEKKEVIKNNINLVKISENYNLEDIEKSLLKVFKIQFKNTNIIFANALRLFALRQLMSKIIIKNQ